MIKRVAKGASRPPSGQINWQAAHAHLDAVGRSLRGEEASSREAIEVILHQRAAMASRPPDVSAQTKLNGVVFFTVGSRRFGVEARHVAEVISAAGLIFLPCGNAAVVGVVSRRSRVIIVYDPTDWLDETAPSTPTDSRIVIIEHGGLQFGLLTTGTVAHELLQDAMVSSTPSIQRGPGDGLIRGVTTDLGAVLDVEILCLGRWLIVDEQLDD